jgi:hypothetical protein
VRQYSALQRFACSALLRTKSNLSASSWHAADGNHAAAQHERLMRLMFFD